jgi:hypothetical protein
MEFVIAMPLAVVLVCSNGLFLIGATRLPWNRPWPFFFLPGSLLSCSTLQFVQLLHPARIASIWALGEKKFWKNMVWFSFFPLSEKDAKGPDDSGAKQFEAERQAKKNTLCHWLKFCLGVCLHISLLFVSFQGMLLKLSSIHFAPVTNSLEWTASEWLLVLGFFNQLATAVNPNIVEVHRMLMFLFTGADPVWTKHQCITAHAFFRVLGRRITDGLIGTECVVGPMRIGSLATMWNLTAVDLQKLVCCPLREGRVYRSDAFRLEVLEKLWNPPQCEQVLQGLEEAEKGKASTEDVLKGEAMRLAAIRDTLLQEVISVSENKQGDIPTSMRLSLAAEIQNSIEDLDSIEDCGATPLSKV